MTWTVGVVKHGNDHVDPSPGSATLVTIESFHDNDHTGTTEVVWDGYTPADVTTNRVKRWEDARTRYEADGPVLTCWTADDRSQRLTLTALPAPTQGDPT